MLRNLLLASLCILPGYASAQAVVADPFSHMQQVLSRVEQANAALRQLQEAQRQYQVMSNTYSSLAGARDIGGIANALGGVSRTYLPEASSTISAIGRGSNLLDRAGSSRAADQLFIPQIAEGSRTGERWLKEMERRQNVTANAKAIAENGLYDTEQRIQQLRNAEMRLATTMDLKDTADVTGLLAVTQQNLSMHNASVNSIRLALHAEDRAERQRGEQMQALGAHEWSESTRWAVDALGR